MPAKIAEADMRSRIDALGLKIVGSYLNASTPTEFVCKCGELWVTTATAVLSGRRCQKCYGNARVTSEVVNARIAHLNIKIIGELVNVDTKTSFACNNGHIWDTKPARAMKSKGCPYCKNRAPLTKEIVNDRISVRGIRMTGDYNGVMNKTTFLCLHGHEWKSTPDNVIRGNGCPYCAGKARLSEEVINSRLEDRKIKITGKFKTTGTPTTFKCEKGHEWKTAPGNVMMGRGCPHCADTGFNPSKPALLYYLRVESEGTVAYKIGITNRTVEKRFENEIDKIKVIKIKHYNVGYDAYKEEQSLLRKHAEHKYTGFKLLKSGFTEMFKRDVLELDH